MKAPFLTLALRSKNRRGPRLRCREGGERGRVGRRCIWINPIGEHGYIVRGTAIMPAERRRGRGKWQLVLKRRHRSRGWLVARVFDELHGWTRTKVKLSFGFSFSQLSPPAYPFDGLNFFTTATPHFSSGWQLPSCARSRRGILSELRRSGGDHGRNLVIDEARFELDQFFFLFIPSFSVFLFSFKFWSCLFALWRIIFDWINLLRYIRYKLYLWMV